MEIFLILVFLKYKKKLIPGEKGFKGIQ
jgi:hypothetical protein